MKKLLLSMAAVVMSFSAFAATTTITWADQAANLPATWGAENTFSAEGFQFNIKKNKGATNPTYNANGKDLRTYAQATITITSGSPMTEIDFVISTAGLKRLTGVTADAGTVSGLENCTGKKQGDVVVKWTGSATSVTFTVDKQATYGTDGNTKAGQFDFISTAISTDGAVVTKDPAGLSFPQASYEVKLGQPFSAPALSKMTDAEAVYSSSVETVATVDAATGAVTVVGEGSTVITAKTEETDDFYAGEAQYTLVVIGENNVYTWDWVASKEKAFTFDQTGTVPWNYDDKYGLKGSAYVSGKGQAADAVAASPVIDLTDRVAPATATVHMAVNQYKLNGTMIKPAELGTYAKFVVREEGDTEWTVLADATTKSFSWTYFDADPIDLSAYVGKKIQFGFRYISVPECAGTWEIDKLSVSAVKDSQSVESIEAVDNDAPVVYYNLQGVRVDNPSNGLYIRVQGKKASKVLVK